MTTKDKLIIIESAKAKYSCGHWDYIPSGLYTLQSLQAEIEKCSKFKVCKACWNKRLKQYEPPEILQRILSD